MKETPPRREAALLPRRETALQPANAKLQPANAKPPLQPANPEPPLLLPAHPPNPPKAGKLPNATHLPLAHLPLALADKGTREPLSTMAPRSATLSWTATTNNWIGIAFHD